MLSRTNRLFLSFGLRILSFGLQTLFFCAAGSHVPKRTFTLPVLENQHFRCKILQMSIALIGCAYGVFILQIFISFLIGGVYGLMPLASTFGTLIGGAYGGGVYE